MNRLEIAPRALQQIREISSWWRENRTQSMQLFADELADALENVLTTPQIGVAYRRRRDVTIRRVLLVRTRYHVYFSYDETENLVSVRAVWHAARGKGPPLR